jgi:Cu(I)/Ag(I) efflux system membrane protein CusA/SilA
VAEVAPVGGFVKQYQVDLDPNKLAAYGIPLSDVVDKIRRSNSDVGGKVFEVSSTEYYVRGRGYIKSLADIEDIPLKVDNGTPVYVRNVGLVHLGPDLRRGVAELDGKGETVGGIVVMRYGENALTVIDGIKEEAEGRSPLPCPRASRIVPTYDRSELIDAPSRPCGKSSSRRASSSPWSAWSSSGTCARPWSRSSRCPSRSSSPSSPCAPWG